MSLFYDTLDKDTNFDFKRRKKAFKKGKPCAICGKRLVSELMMVAHKVLIKLDKGWSLEPIDISGIN